MQQKTERLQEKSSQLGLKINVGKTKVMKVNSRSSGPISLESGTVEEVQDFIYIGSNISTNGGADKDVDRTSAVYSILLSTVASSIEYVIHQWHFG